MRFGQDDKRIIDFVESVCRDLGLTEEIKRQTNENFCLSTKLVGECGWLGLSNRRGKTKTIISKPTVPSSKRNSRTSVRDAKHTNASFKNYIIWHRLLIVLRNILLGSLVDDTTPYRVFPSRAIRTWWLFYFIIARRHGTRRVVSSMI